MWCPGGESDGQSGLSRRPDKQTSTLAHAHERTPWTELPRCGKYLPQCTETQLADASNCVIRNRNGMRRGVNGALHPGSPAYSSRLCNLLINAVCPGPLFGSGRKLVGHVQSWSRAWAASRSAGSIATTCRTTPPPYRVDKIIVVD